MALAAKSWVHSSKVRAVSREGAGLCHHSPTECHIPVTVPGDSWHCNKAWEGLEPAHKEQNGSAGSLGRSVPVRVLVDRGCGLATLLLRGCEIKPA